MSDTTNPDHETVTSERWKPGDVLVYRDRDGVPVYRVVLEATPTGYVWTYPHLPLNSFDSANSNDPRLSWGWKRVDPLDMYGSGAL